MDDDQASTFSYDGEGVPGPDSFSITQLNVAVDSYFQTPCRLEKLAEGGYHKVYEILHIDGQPQDAVVRVACPAFPTDKLESEIATLKFLAARTKVPVPRILTWDSDASNPVGAEYMIMQKVPGVSMSDKWDTLPTEQKDAIVSQVARHLFDIFSLRFDLAGSLYQSKKLFDNWKKNFLPELEVDSEGFFVGPIVSVPFYRALDGVVRNPSSPFSSDVHPNRGPFTSVTDYLCSPLRAELDFVSHNTHIVLSTLEGEDHSYDKDGEDGDNAARLLKQGERVLKKAIELCSIYPGDISILKHTGSEEERFSLKLDDFRMSNIMINETSGEVTAFIDFEGATIAPLWECATIPRWLQDYDDPESSHEGGPSEARVSSRTAFLDAVKRLDEHGEWLEAYKAGRPFRQLVERSNFQVTVLAQLEEWVDERLLWAKEHPGVGFPEDDF